MGVRYSTQSLALAIGIAAGLFCAELATRAYFAWNVGPRVLLYGSEWFRNIEYREQEKKSGFSEVGKRELATEWARKDSVENHEQSLGSYSKFFPNETKSTRDVDTGERIPVAISKQGFRGKNFAITKAPGVIRILTLGSSSTFGFYNRDDETYPYFMQRLLEERCARGRRFEVINFAIPHMTSDSIAAMFASEGVALSPDVITFYEGRNESIPSQKKYDSLVEKIHSVLVHRLLLVAFLDQVYGGKRTSVTDPSLKVGALADERSRLFLKNLTDILDAARRTGTKLIVANQQATSKSPVPVVAAERLSLRGVTYGQEAEEIERRMAQNKEVTSFEQSFLVHRRLMKDLRQWANAQEVPFVDIIGALDQQRHHMLSWVHMHPEANRIVAGEFSDAILREFCTPEAAGGTGGEMTRPAR